MMRTVIVLNYSYGQVQTFEYDYTRYLEWLEDDSIEDPEPIDYIEFWYDVSFNRSEIDWMDVSKLKIIHNFYDDVHW